MNSVTHARCKDTRLRRIKRRKPSWIYLNLFCFSVVFVCTLMTTVSVSYMLNLREQRVRDLNQLYATVRELNEMKSVVKRLNEATTTTASFTPSTPSSPGSKRTTKNYKTGPRKVCPDSVGDFQGDLSIVEDDISMEFVEKLYPEVKFGGTWKPETCTSQYNIAILVPYRDRARHLKIFLRHMHSFLQKQHLSYTIFVIEQTNFTAFNRGFLLNVGFIEARAVDHYDCYFFHDVDLLPEDDRNFYTCPFYPRLMSVSRKNANYSLPYFEYFGGVTSMSGSHYLRINGYSNRFFGWGGEDDDIFTRIRKRGLIIDRVNPIFGRYYSLDHKKAKPNDKRLRIMTANMREHFREGLSTTRYREVKREKRKLYTWILAHPL